MSVEKLKSRVKAVWRREQLFCVLHGGLVFLRWGIVMFLAGWLVDWLSSKWLVDIPAPGRGFILAAVLGVSLRKAWLGGWRKIRRFDAARTSLQIEAGRGGMQSLLVTALQFGSDENRDGTSRELAELTCRKAEEAAAGIQAADAVKFKELRRPGFIALGAAVIAGVLCITHGALMLAGVGRIFAPWLAISYPTRTQLAVQGGDIVVQEGKPVNISALVSGAVPRRARLAIKTGNSRPRVRSIDVVDGVCEYSIDTAFRGFTYQISAGDARSGWHEVRVIAAPHIKRAAVTLEFPEYTKRKPETVDAMTFTVPETTRVSWELELDVPVREGALQLSGQEAVPVTISADGLTAGISRGATESRAYTFSWVEREHGYMFTSPSYYLQVAPDQAPRVELTSPARNVYATPGRKMELAFRGRDDHGIGESAVAYQVDKTAEERVSFTPSAEIDGTEQVIDWDYRNVLTNLMIGQTVTFAVELADRYPGETGPHRVRSESRRIQFMSVEDYLAEVEKQKKRLLSQLRTIYREERKVHELVLRLDPSDPVFIQTCQLEAVRQDLMRERIGRLAGSMLELTEDIAANSISNETVSASLTVLREDLLRVSSNHIAAASVSLRALAGEKDGKSGKVAEAKAEAAHMVDSSARELGLLVLHLSYPDAAEVMARELHAAAETEAVLRLRTVLPSEGRDELAASQERLGQWLKRLFEANPRNRESTPEEALIEFTLSRLVKQMINAGIDAQMEAASGLIRDGKPEEAARIQAEVVQVLLNAEFRLRAGAERESLSVAKELFQSQARSLSELNAEISAADESTFARMKARYADEQRVLHAKLQLLLMPHVPERRARLFDDVLPSPPPVADLLSAADAAMKSAADALVRGDRAGAVKEQSSAGECFSKLAAVTGGRIAAMLQAVRIGRLVFVASDTNEQIVRLYERQLSLIEKTEDAAADGTNSAYLADQQAGLAEAVAALQGELELNLSMAEVQTEHAPVIAARVADAGHLMKETILLLKDNKADKAVELQGHAASALTQAQELLVEHGSTLGVYAASLAAANDAVKPSPFVAEIEDEQREMLEVTRKTKKEDLPGLAIPQKNLVHAVNATLNALDPVAHLVGSGTTMMFAKEDMAAAAEAMELGDPVEALDAQEYIVETLGDLRIKLDAVIPRFFYIFEMNEALHESARECMLVREEQRSLRDQVLAGAELAGAGAEQGKIRNRAEEQGRILHRVAGMSKLDGAAGAMGEAEQKLKAGDRGGACDAMLVAEELLKAEMLPVAELMNLLQQVLAPPLPEVKISEEVLLLQEVLAMASKHKAVHRESSAVKPEQLKVFAAGLREFEKLCDPFIAKAKTHKNPAPREVVVKGKQPAVAEAPKPETPSNLHLKLVKAKEQLAKAAAGAAAGDRGMVVEANTTSAEHLRHFVAEYALKFVVIPGGGGDSPPAPSENFTETDDMFQLFMPGAVTGVRPPDGRLEWEVLGKRDRAALNENFARELPLEYRAILKDYYERLAE